MLKILKRILCRKSHKNKTITIKSNTDKLIELDDNFGIQFHKKNNDYNAKNVQEYNIKIDSVINEEQFINSIDDTEIKPIFEVMENTNTSIFITGKAGTGKSTLVQYFKIKTKKKVVFIAPTGVAAINIQGKTIHSMFKFPHIIITKALCDGLNYSQTTIELLNRIDSILIDEISMVRVDILQGVDYMLKKHRKNNNPFGGVQMFFVGDVYQLPPIVGKEFVTILDKGVPFYVGRIRTYFQKRYGGPFFFNCDGFKILNPVFYELTKIHRQKDSDFIEILNVIRERKHTIDTLNRINQQKKDKTFKRNEISITLCIYKGDAEAKNKKMLEGLSSTLFTYECERTGVFLDFKSENEIVYPADKTLDLRVGSQVMLLVNDLYGRWVNGTLAIVDSLSNDEIKVIIHDESYVINRHTWETFEYDYDQEYDRLRQKRIGTFTQFPVTLAWAITVHKSQGKTFENAIINIGSGAFVHGQIYVALSRCRTLNGISLEKQINDKDIIVDKEIINFSKTLKSKIIRDE